MKDEFLKLGIEEKVVDELLKKIQFLKINLMK